ncbi:MAG: alcohol dehydrogenase catalytic domain-containing protein [Chloroflexi bacterium]|nr:alcohol dehydrogenase catalytic domain-containing protein [Chloroflexota bacterium]
MRVATYYNNRDVRLEERPVPKIGPGELLVKVIASGICGSDVMEWYRIHKAPLVLGHEVAGQIVAVGQGVAQFKEGQAVALAHHVPCNTCHYCRAGHHTVCDTLRTTNFDPGGFAEYLRLPAINVDRGVFPIPDEVSFEDATFTEPLACVLRGQRLAGFQPGQSVLVIGSGISGLLHIHLAQALGASRIVATDIVGYRLEAAMRFGADHAFQAKDYTPESLRDANDGRLADLVVLCTGALSAIDQALRSAERGGTILFFAPAEPKVTAALPLWDLWRDGITLTVSYAGSPADYATALELIRARRVRVGEMITHRLGLAETGRGFQLVASARDSIKVIIEPQR